MEIPFTAENLAKPWFRAIIGIIFIVVGFIGISSDDMYYNVTRENCIEGEGTLYEMRLDTSSGIHNTSIWIIFDDYEQSLFIHSRCTTDELIDTMLNLEKGTKLKFLHSRDNSNIYELWVDGKQLLDFDTAKEKIDKNISILITISYIILPVGALFFISSFIKFKKKET